MRRLPEFPPRHEIKMPDAYGVCIRLFQIIDGTPHLYVVREKKHPGEPLNCITETLKHRVVEMLVSEWKKAILTQGRWLLSSPDAFESFIITSQQFLEKELARALAEEFGLLNRGEVIDAYVGLFPTVHVAGTDKKHSGKLLGLIDVVAILKTDASSDFSTHAPTASEEVAPAGFLDLSKVKSMASEGTPFRPFLFESTGMTNPTDLLYALSTSGESLITVAGVPYIFCRVTRELQISVLTDSDLPDYSDREPIQLDRQKPRSDQATLGRDSLLTNQR